MINSITDFRKEINTQQNSFVEFKLLNFES